MAWPASGSIATWRSPSCLPPACSACCGGGCSASSLTHPPVVVLNGFAAGFRTSRPGGGLGGESTLWISQAGDRGHPWHGRANADGYHQVVRQRRVGVGCHRPPEPPAPVRTYLEQARQP